MLLFNLEILDEKPLLADTLFGDVKSRRTWVSNFDQVGGCEEEAGGLNH
jgi:hypothetical protein